MATIAIEEIPDVTHLRLTWTPLTAEDCPQPSEDSYHDHTLYCGYTLHLHLDVLDIRRENSEGEAVEKFRVAKMPGGTFSTGIRGSISRYDEEWDTVEAPFRDGAHALWDSKKLGHIPIYVCDLDSGRASRLEGRD